jgi:AAHS family 4-hydroxybenzoate transporter-like MFS transporter
MTGNDRVEISALIDETGLTKFNIGLTVFALFVMLFDGYDVSSLAFAGPSIIKTWHLANKGVLGPIFSASLFGMMFGATILGWIGDRAGRKVAVAVACLVMGASSLACSMSTELWQLVVLRFMTGLGMGGLAPNMISLVAEYAPKRFRATMVICMYTGITLGGAVVGAVAAGLVAAYGWQMLFLIGGAGPLVMALLVALFMPESIKFLATHRRGERRIAALVSRFAKTKFAPGTTFYLVDEAAANGPVKRIVSPVFLFSKGLILATLSLWICMAGGLMGYYFLMNWTPILFEQAHVAPSVAALATSIFQIGGTVGGLTLSRLIDRRGVGAIAVLFMAAVPIIGTVGLLTDSKPLLFAGMFLAGFCALGIQFGVNAIASIVYPTYCRTYAMGWAFAVGRIGAIVGPVVGGLIVELRLPIQVIFCVAAIPFVIGLIGSVMLGRAYSTMAAGDHLSDGDIEMASAIRCSN